MYLAVYAQIPIATRSSPTKSSAAGSCPAESATTPPARNNISEKSTSLVRGLLDTPAQALSLSIPSCVGLTFACLDDAILTALGSPAEFKGEQRDSFCAGLRGVLLDLRVRKIRDFDIIATEIIAYRAKFLGDKSKVLAALEGTTI